jgi:acetyl esterase/lipase
MKSSLLLVGALALFTTISSADEVVRIDLDGKQGVAPPAQEEGKDGIARIKDVGTAQLELFPTAAKESKGTIMISPGGGYSILAAGHEGRNVAKMLNEDGWDAAVLLYHVSAGPTTKELAMADAKKALALLQKRGGEFKLSTKKIGILGFSAGGHLTARLAHESEKSNPPQFVILMYPAYLERDGKVLEDVAPIKAPTFIYVAGNDKLVPSSIAYDAASQALGNQHELHKPELGGHGFGLKEGMPDSVKDWPAKLKAFLATLK